MTIQVGNVTTSAASIYTSSGNSAVTFLSLCNYSASNITANVYVVPSASSAANSNIIVKSLTITVGDTYQLYSHSEKLLLSNGDSIQANASADNSITSVTSYTAI